MSPTSLGGVPLKGNRTRFLRARIRVEDGRTSSVKTPSGGDGVIPPRDVKTSREMFPQPMQPRKLAVISLRIVKIARTTTYVSEAEEDDESLEYTSDVASVKEPDMGDAEGSSIEADDASTRQLDMAMYQDSTRVNTNATNATDQWSMSVVEDQEHNLTSGDNGPDSGSSGSTDCGECQELEHLAGPHCEHASGYCGFNINAAEMKGCTTVQCLAVKSSEWTPEPDDQDFERSGKCYLSGLCGQMPSRDIGWPTMTPPRHGARDIDPDTVLWNNGGVSDSFPRPVSLTAPELTRGLKNPHADESDTPIPFHPTCFEIYTRASRLRTASNDVAGLVGWRILESDYDTDRAFPRHEAVKRSREQEWLHQPGSEWLAANPVVVPGFSWILRPAVSASNGCATDAPPGRTVSEDPLSKLLREIADIIIEMLSPVDVAALRLAGCARFLAIENWYRSLGEEMPWLWEVWDTALPSLWATTTVSALSVEMERKNKTEKRRLAARDVIEQEMPELLENWDMDNAKELDESYATCGKEALKEITVLPKYKTNWCRVYYEVKTNWDALKGLQNRKRIWRDVEEILRRITEYRDEGRIA